MRFYTKKLPDLPARVGRLARVGRRHDACTGERLVLIRPPRRLPRSTPRTLVTRAGRTGCARTTRRRGTDAAGTGWRAGASPGREGCRDGARPARLSAIRARARGGRRARVGVGGSIGRGVGGRGSGGASRRCGSPRCAPTCGSWPKPRRCAGSVRRSLTANDDLTRWATAVLASVSMWQARHRRSACPHRRSAAGRRRGRTVGLRRGHGGSRAAWCRGRVCCGPAARGIVRGRRPRRR